MGLSGRATYGYDDRYFGELNFGYNGSEKFAENNRFGFFPSAGLGWIVSNESFFDDFKGTISLLKLKFTYGLVGNDNIAPASDRFLSDVNLNEGGRSTHGVMITLTTLMDTIFTDTQTQMLLGKLLKKLTWIRD